MAAALTVTLGTGQVCLKLVIEVPSNADWGSLRGLVARPRCIGVVITKSGSTLYRGYTSHPPIPSPLFPLRSLNEHIRRPGETDDVDGYRGAQVHKCVCVKEKRGVAVKNCRERRGGEGRRRKRSVRDAQKSLQLLVMARCDLRDKPIREQERGRMRNTTERNKQR